MFVCVCVRVCTCACVVCVYVRMYMCVCVCLSVCFVPKQMAVCVFIHVVPSPHALNPEPTRVRPHAQIPPSPPSLPRPPFLASPYCALLRISTADVRDSECGISILLSINPKLGINKLPMQGLCDCGGLVCGEGNDSVAIRIGMGERGGGIRSFISAFAVHFCVASGF